jgi:MFS family permease
VLFVSVMMATTEPTPLYAFWERSYTFGPIVTTLVLATYAIGVIAALLFAGRDSDVDGRRPVLLACVALSALSSVLFLLADGLPMLFAARLVSGFSARRPGGHGAAVEQGRSRRRQPAGARPGADHGRCARRP